MDNTLVVIPARSGSKRLPDKNIRLLDGKPLIRYSIDVARTVFDDQRICVSTDSLIIKAIAEQAGLTVPFVRPDALATDTASTQDVLLHALKHYRRHNEFAIKQVLLLQPTSPFRTSQQLRAALQLFSPDIDMVVSVKQTKANPYFTLYEAGADGYLAKSKPTNFVRAQDCPPVYELNGSVYVLNAESLIASSIADFRRVVPFLMEEMYSVDIDTEFDWHLAEFTVQHMRSTI